jgi:hypothetical protein
VKRLDIVPIALFLTPSRLAKSLLVVFLAIVLSSGRSLGANAIVEGDDWLKWNDETKLEYVSAYLSGYGRGFRDGCETGQRLYFAGKPKDLPGEKCLPEAASPSKYLENYAAMITAFYRTYPEDKRVPIHTLLDGMSDQKNLTQKQMHEYYGSNTETRSK